MDCYFTWGAGWKFVAQMRTCIYYSDLTEGCVTAVTYPPPPVRTCVHPDRWIVCKSSSLSKLLLGFCTSRSAELCTLTNNRELTLCENRCDRGEQELCDSPAEAVKAHFGTDKFPVCGGWFVVSAAWVIHPAAPPHPARTHYSQTCWGAGGPTRGPGDFCSSIRPLGLCVKTCAQQIWRCRSSNASDQ